MESHTSPADIVKNIYREASIKQLLSTEKTNFHIKKVLYGKTVWQLSVSENIFEIVVLYTKRLGTV